MSFSVTPTWSDRTTWLVNPFAYDAPWWVSLIAVLPAILGSILIYMDHQITVVIVNREENKLKVMKKLV